MHEDLTLRQLEDLGLWRELEAADRADRLKAHRISVPVTRLERLIASVHLETTHWLALRILCWCLGLLLLRLAPVTFKVPRLRSAVIALAGSSKQARLFGICAGLRELEAYRASSTSASAGVANCHALTSAVSRASPCSVNAETALSLL